MIRLLLIFTTVVSVFVFVCADEDSHHHHVIIHVPFKIHTVHRTILKHVHHRDKGGDDRYEVLGYTVGKPIEHGPPFDAPELPVTRPHQPYPVHQHELSGNELGHGSASHQWTPGYGQLDFVHPGTGHLPIDPYHHQPSFEHGHQFAGHQPGFPSYD